MLNAIGRREIVGLIVLLLAVASALAALRNGDGEEQTKSLPVQAGQRLGAPAPAPAEWLIEFSSQKTPGDSVSNGPSALKVLDLNFETVPFPDFEDGKWSVVAEGHIPLAPGPYSFVLEYRGDIRVLINGTEAAKGSSGARVVPVTIAFQSDADGVGVRIEAKDTQGPFTLRWRT
jgi:hypothetical protein